MTAITKLPREEFAALIARQGLAHDPSELDALYEGYGHVAAMAALVRQPRSHMAEPALTFSPASEG